VPEASGWAMAHIPGVGLLRDGTRLLVLCAPLLAVLVAEGALVLWLRRPPVRVAGAALAVALVLGPVAVLPDAAWGVAGRMRPAEYPTAYADAREVVAASVDDGNDVLLLPFSSYRQPDWNHGDKVLDPLGRYLTPDYVASDVLVVSGSRISGEDPRATDAAAALGKPTASERSAALAALGIQFVAIEHEASQETPAIAGAVLLDGPHLSVVRLSHPEPRHVPGTWIVLMVAAWALFVGCLAGSVLLPMRRHPTSPPGDGRGGSRR
jgi:hypothetical protein